MHLRARNARGVKVLFRENAFRPACTVHADRNQGYLIEGATVSGVRASIGAKKHHNGCGAKGDRRVDE
ncbi:MAG: hypothetical protein HY607_04585 [Planctomycetes bacterium]|uniref:hypothetical protein n=1 Tax=Candidatus Wunengus californicus TaxID=3367619 RepID=UPI0040266A8E|nr:hypothetical protein [Planctomycetota bacterium]MBI4221944.1 hypothetical protein [Planctomycetota bacterium]